MTNFLFRRCISYPPRNPHPHPSPHRPRPTVGTNSEHTADDLYQTIVLKLLERAAEDPVLLSAQTSRSSPSPSGAPAPEPKPVVPSPATAPTKPTSSTTTET